MSHPAWHEEMAAAVEASGLDRFSPAWYAAMRDEYLTRFPDSDERSKDNMRAAADRAALGDVAGRATVETVGGDVGDGAGQPAEPTDKADLSQPRPAAPDPRGTA